MEQTEVLVVGAGQAGVAMSEHLTARGIAHLVLEKGRIAEKWRSGRWDSLVTNGPVWHDRFPGMTFEGDPDAFAPKEAVADYFAAYAARFGAPIREGVEVTRLRRAERGPGFVAETSAGPVHAAYVVAATGPFQVPVIPDLIPKDAPLTQIHSAVYRNPGALPPGGVLVVGAGSSGAQIADELNRAGRPTWLCVGPHERPPRRYRGRDFGWWLGVMGRWDEETPPGKGHTTIAVSGAHGGRTVDFRQLAAEGLHLLGSARNYDGSTLSIAPNLRENIAGGDANLLEFLASADAYAKANGLDLPLEPQARAMLPDPPALTDPVLSLDLAAEGISTVIWATGYTQDFSWLQVNAFDEAGRPRHRRGITAEDGVFFLGLPYLTRRGSSFIWGVWQDARHLAQVIETRRAYLAYPGTPALSEPKMTHERIRPFNTAQTYPEQKLDNDLAHAVVTRGGRTVWLRGQCPQDIDTFKDIGSHDPVEQTHKVMQNIRQLVTEAGGGMEHVVKIVVYITDVRYREAVYRTMGEYLKGVHPVSTGLVVPALARPSWLVEIDATAVIPD